MYIINIMFILCAQMYISGETDAMQKSRSQQFSWQKSDDII